VKSLMLALALVLAINLHGTNAQCQLPAANQVVADSTTATTTTDSGTYTVLADVGMICARACDLCGQDVAAVSGATPTGFRTAATVIALGQAICPVISYAAADAVAATNFPALGAGATLTGNTLSLSTYNAANVPILSTGQNVLNQATVILTTANADMQAVCPCLVARTNHCNTCTCASQGIPTAAPTGAPTTAPTINTASPTDSSYWTSSDDSLSSGDIAGIVIGAVGGSFLFLLIGVLVGGMVGGKSTAPAAPAGQL